MGGGQSYHGKDKNHKTQAIEEVSLGARKNKSVLKTDEKGAPVNPLIHCQLTLFESQQRSS